MVSEGIAVFISGRGSNLKSLLTKQEQGLLIPEIQFIYSNKKKAPGLAYAEEYGISNISFPFTPGNIARLLDILESKSIKMIMLAGFMRIIPEEFISSYIGKIINIHPSLLPSFPGLDAQSQAWEHGVKISGVTVHFVDNTLDGGTIVMQSPVDISHCSNRNEAAELILQREHEIYYKAANHVWKEFIDNTDVVNS